MTARSEKSEVANSSLLTVNSKNNSLSHQPSAISYQLLNLSLVTRHSLLPLCCLLLTAYCLLFVIGCGHAPPALSDKHLQAIEFNQKAESAFKKGDYQKALNLYSEALRINHSIENIDGIATNLINMATVYHKLGDKDNANRCVDEIVRSAEFGVRSELLSEATFIKARLYTDDENYTQALEWTDKALSFCNDGQCRMEGRIYNLKSRIAFLKGDFSSAVTYAGRGLELNKKHEDSEEIANSLRILAEIKSAKKEYNEARTLFENALVVDKTIGANKKIARDLMGIGDILFKQGMCENALKYYKRALSVSEGSGDKQGIKDAMTAIGKCLQP